MREALLGGPRLEQHRQAFLEACIGVGHRNVEAGEFVVAVTFADAEIQAATGKQVESGGLFCEQDGVVPWQHDHRGAEAQRAGAGAEPGQQVQRR
jgi:hypothetical protein